MRSRLARGSPGTTTRRITSKFFLDSSSVHVSRPGDRVWMTKGVPWEWQT